VCGTLVNRPDFLGALEKHLPVERLEDSIVQQQTAGAFYLNLPEFT
jgi:hypothetical protein